MSLNYDRELITGVTVQYYVTCRREAWLFAHKIAPDQEDDNILMGRALARIQEEKQLADFPFSNLKFDKIAKERGHYVVTEYGIARLRGLSIRERVLNMVEIAHPDHREGLLRDAHKWGWIPKFYNVAPKEYIESEGEIKSKKVYFKGHGFIYRPLYPSDTRRLQEFFYSHSEETVSMRYGHVKDRMSNESAYKLTSVDQSKDLAFALFKETGHRQQIVAVARFYQDPKGKSAEVAFMVGEAVRRLGMSQFLLGALAGVAQKRGVKTFWASVLKRNKPMAALFLKNGAEKESVFGEDSDEYTMEVDVVLKGGVSKM